MKIVDIENGIVHKVYGTQIYEGKTIFLIFVLSEFIWIDATGVEPYED